jgi:hypothetical protein
LVRELETNKECKWRWCERDSDWSESYIETTRNAMGDGVKEILNGQRARNKQGMLREMV